MPQLIVFVSVARPCECIFARIQPKRVLLQENIARYAKKIACAEEDSYQWKDGNEVLHDIHCTFPAVCNWHIHKGVETMYSLMRMCVTIIIILGYTV